ncbi:MAG TPA: rhomboid family intramembrane serine protease [Bdellovibrionales bacterium]|nr:rhomboid family intramembrane serine protease [Bdellovibrionales bacterium]
MGYRGGPQIQSMIPLTSMVKKLMIANVAIWVLLQVILEGFILDKPYLSYYFSLSPMRVVEDYFIWQPFTYMFLHSTSSLWHLIFNMLMLWWLGAELEMRWGSRFFLLYYLVCGVGAAFFYIIFVFGFSFVTGRMIGLLEAPVIGASGAIFGLMLAYGIIFGERIVYFMFLFAMKAKYMVMLLGAIEIFTIMTSGVDGRGGVSNLAHVFGLLSGFLFLTGWTRWQRRKSQKSGQRWGRKLKLVVNNEDDGERGPKYWN